MRFTYVPLFLLIALCGISNFVRADDASKAVHSASNSDRIDKKPNPTSQGTAKSDLVNPASVSECGEMKNGKWIDVSCEKYNPVPIEQPKLDFSLSVYVTGLVEADEGGVEDPGHAFEISSSFVLPGEKIKLLGKQIWSGEAIFPFRCQIYPRTSEERCNWIREKGLVPATGANRTAVIEDKLQVFTDRDGTKKSAHPLLPETTFAIHTATSGKFCEVYLPDFTSGWVLCAALARDEEHVSPAMQLARLVALEAHGSYKAALDSTKLALKSPNIAWRKQLEAKLPGLESKYKEDLAARESEDYQSCSPDPSYVPGE